MILLCRPCKCGRVFCLWITLLSSAKTAEPIEMPFGWVTPVGPNDHVDLLDGLELTMKKGNSVVIRPTEKNSKA